MCHRHKSLILYDCLQHGIRYTIRTHCTGFGIIIDTYVHGGERIQFDLFRIFTTPSRFARWRFGLYRPDKRTDKKMLVVFLLVLCTDFLRVFNRMRSALVVPTEIANRMNYTYCPMSPARIWLFSDNDQTRVLINTRKRNERVSECAARIRFYVVLFVSM